MPRGVKNRPSAPRQRQQGQSLPHTPEFIELLGSHPEIGEATEQYLQLSQYALQLVMLSLGTAFIGVLQTQHPCNVGAIKAAFIPNEAN